MVFVESVLINTNANVKPSSLLIIRAIELGLDITLKYMKYCEIRVDQRNKRTVFEIHSV